MTQSFDRLAALKENLERQELQSSYQDVINIQEALQREWSRESVIVDKGCDEQNGSYPYEIHVDVYPATYRHDAERGNWVASRKYVGGLNRLQDNQFQYFETKEEAIAFVKQAWF